MEIIILAGGLGTRLRSEVSNLPKCMASIAGKPFLWYLLKKVNKNENVTRVILSVGYLREIIIEWISTIQNQFNYSFDFAIENEPLGTGGGIRLAMEKVTEKEAIILNGDTFFDVDLDKLISEHNSNPYSDITIVLKQMKDFDRYGTVSIDDKGCIMKFNEKQSCKEGLINGGIYCLSKDSTIFNGLPMQFSFENDILQNKCGDGGCVYSIIQNGPFIDIGVPDDYYKAQNCLIKWFDK